MVLNDFGWYRATRGQIEYSASGGANIGTSSASRTRTRMRSPQIATVSQIAGAAEFVGPGNKSEERQGKKRVERIDHSVRRCRDVERLRRGPTARAAFYEFPPWNLHFFPARRGWDKAKPYSLQVLFKFSSPLGASCALSPHSPFDSPSCGRFSGTKSRTKICGIAWPRAVLPPSGHLPRVFKAFPAGLAPRSLTFRYRTTREGDNLR